MNLRKFQATSLAFLFSTTCFSYPTRKALYCTIGIESLGKTLGTSNRIEVKEGDHSVSVFDPTMRHMARAQMQIQGGSLSVKLTSTVQPEYGQWLEDAMSPMGEKGRVKSTLKPFDLDGDDVISFNYDYFNSKVFFEGVYVDNSDRDFDRLFHLEEEFDVLVKIFLEKASLDHERRKFLDFLYPRLAAYPVPLFLMIAGILKGGPEGGVAVSLGGATAIFFEVLIMLVNSSPSSTRGKKRKLRSFLEEMRAFLRTPHALLQLDELKRTVELATHYREFDGVAKIHKGESVSELKSIEDSIYLKFQEIVQEVKRIKNNGENILEQETPIKNYDPLESDLGDERTLTGSPDFWP